MKSSRLIVVVGATACVLIGLSLTAKWILQPKPATTISTGMTMASVLGTMEQRGLDPGKMQFAGPHHAFDLPDGRAIVLFGNQTVDEIQLIANPATPKSARVTTIVPTITF